MTGTSSRASIPRIYSSNFINHILGDAPVPQGRPRKLTSNGAPDSDSRHELKHLTTLGGKNGPFGHFGHQNWSFCNRPILAVNFRSGLTLVRAASRSAAVSPDWAIKLVGGFSTSIEGGIRIRLQRDGFLKPIVPLAL